MVTHADITPKFKMANLIALRRMLSDVSGSRESKMAAVKSEN